MEFINIIDTYLFYLINVSLSNPIFDKIFPFITDNKNWFLLYIFFIGFMLWKGQFKGRKMIITLLITILISDQLASSVIKEIVQRIRPCHILSNIHLLVPCGAGKSFPSSHAVNNFAAAIIISYYYKDYKIVLYFIAFLVAFSRVVVGVHYPFDVISGAFIGWFIGYLIIQFDKKLSLKYPKLNHNL